MQRVVTKKSLKNFKTTKGLQVSTQKTFITSTVNCEKKNQNTTDGDRGGGKGKNNTEFIGLAFSDEKQVKISA